MNTLHTVVGAGQVGFKLATTLRSRGHRVRVVRRSTAAGPPGVETVAADLLAGASKSPFTGSAVVYHCANPAYHRWREELLPLSRAITAGAKAAGARLVVLDNLYALGLTSGPMRERSPMQPRSRKGALREQMAHELFAAKENGLELAIVRASDFFGPGVTESTVFYPSAMERLVAGKPVNFFGDPDMPHSYTYVDDVVSTLAALGEAARLDVDGDHPIWHVPTAWHGGSRELLARLGSEVGTDGAVRRVPSWLLGVAGLVSPLAREVREMVYQWTAPFVIDDQRVRRVFGLSPTPVDEAIAQTARAIRLRARQAPATMVV